MVVIIIIAILSVEAIVQTLCGQNWQRDSLILTGGVLDNAVFTPHFGLGRLGDYGLGGLGA